MVDLFKGKRLIKNSKTQDEVATVPDLENRVVLLYFGSGECPRCLQFLPILKNFFTMLTDEFYVDRASQLVLVYISQDDTWEKQEKFLKKLPKKGFFLRFGDKYNRVLERQYDVVQIPTLVVLKPSGELISKNAVDEVKRFGPACFKNWQEVSDVINRDFLPAEAFDDLPLKSITDPLRARKYKVQKKKKSEWEKKLGGR
ncbi:nucleoredoxin-like protein 1 [Latimeria chalumnae]|uniref:nucleoredoxin-like protein 1 n=1 Tax=Latimeria chalumnae TaxID=7897 RepID=UPI0003C12AC2|nr:PREDICTED: nucleoredoxin-like protein 1 [Latimeria chalumnae]|eukprot:XP_005991851.1 PREDICTED: nucleoredoxin-like protein 1 [Latimeria chalumnae]